MRIRLFTSLLTVLFFTQPVFANDTLILQKIGEYMLKSSNAHSNLRVLCKDIGPRLSGSIGSYKAVDATARMLRDAGADTVYLQPVMVPF
ncbi:MAG TPA: peptidase M28 family protein, partial [Anaerolineae bacterium]|nr:peptidase M28 family protein [Anaerolineae bacterium]